MKTELDSIQEKLLTAQQELAFKDYAEQVTEGREPSAEDYQTFYGYWCYENQRCNDIQESNF